MIRLMTIKTLCRKSSMQQLGAIRKSATLNIEIQENLSPGVRKCVGSWLLTCSGLAFGTVVLGGVTRLTKSGLSMVDWHLFKEFPPFSDEQWRQEFTKYQQFPEYKLSDRKISMGEFKRIWWMEYAHRTLGRTIGLVFLIPATVFWYKNWFTRGMKIRVPIFGALLLTQGLLGWYMVKSGLDEKTAEKYSDPRVSHYRLAAHLGTAFVFYSLLLWTGLSHVLPPKTMPVTNKTVMLRRFAHTSKSLIFLTVVSGAFVAGMDAGLIYNTYPLMGDRFIPSDIMSQSPKWKNFLENPTTTQFDHRILGHVVLAAVTGTWLYSRGVRLPPRVRLSLDCLMIVGLFQVALGIATLMSGVPKTLAAGHQTGALSLLSVAVWVTHELKLIKRIPK